MAYPHKREKIEATVRQWLSEGKFKPGDRFPSDQELARRFRVTHVTVRGALKGLVDEGVLERRIGQGTVVKASAPDRASALASAVGVVIPDNTHSFFGEMLSGIESALFPTRRPLLLAHTWELGEREELAISAWIEQGVTRLIVVPTARASFYEGLVARGVRLVFVDRSVHGVDVPAITSRDDEGAAEMTRALVAMKHRHIVHLAGPASASTARARLEGFRRVMSEAGLPARIVPAGFFADDGYQAMRALLAQGERPDALFASNDPVAIGALRALAEARLEVPGDVSLCGYGDTDLARNFDMTSARQFPERMGIEAVRLLVEQAPLSAARSLEIDAEIVVRKTTTPRAGGAARV